MSDRTGSITQPKPAVVVGIGNILLKDEGIGVYVIRNMDNLAREGVHEYLLVDGGTCPDIFCRLPKEISLLIVVDAVKGGGEPGTIYRFTPEDLAFKRRSVTTLHQLGLSEGLAMMKLMGNYPESVIIVGVEPKEIDWGLAISPELEEIVHHVILLLKQEIASQGRPDHAAAAGSECRCHAEPGLKDALLSESNDSLDL